MRTTCSFFAQRLDGRTVAAAANAAAPAPSTLALAPTPLAGTEDATAAGAVVTAFNFLVPSERKDQIAQSEETRTKRRHRRKVMKNV